MWETPFPPQLSTSFTELYIDKWNSVATKILFKKRCWASYKILL